MNTKGSTNISRFLGLVGLVAALAGLTGFFAFGQMPCAVTADDKLFYGEYPLSFALNLIFLLGGVGLLIYSLVANFGTISSTTSNRRARTALVFGLITFLVLVLLIVVYAITNRADDLYVDMTMDKRYQLSQRTYQVLEDLKQSDKKLSITVLDTGEMNSYYRVLYRRAVEEKNTMKINTLQQNWAITQVANMTLKNYVDNSDGHIEIHYIEKIDPTIKTRYMPTFNLMQDLGSLVIELKNMEDTSESETLDPTKLTEQQAAAEALPKKIIKPKDMIEKTMVPNPMMNNVQEQFKGFIVEKKVTEAIIGLIETSDDATAPKIYFLAGHGEPNYTEAFNYLRETLSNSFTISKFDIPWTGVKGSVYSSQDMAKDLGIIDEKPAEETAGTEGENPENPEDTTENQTETDKEGDTPQPANEEAVPFELETEEPSEAVDYSIPDDCTVLIIAEPTQPLPDEHIQAIREYLEKGKQLVVMKNANVQSDIFGRTMINPKGGPVISSLNKLLKEYGVKLDNAWVLDAEKSGLEVSPSFPARYNAAHEITKPLADANLQIAMYGATSITDVDTSERGITFTKLLHTSSAAQRMNLPYEVTQESVQQANENLEKNKQFVLGALVTKELGDGSDDTNTETPEEDASKEDSKKPKNQLSILLLSSVIPFQDSMLLERNDHHLDFMRNALAYLNDFRHDIAIEARNFNNPEISINKYDVAGFVVVGLLMLGVVISLLGFTFVWLRNRRRETFDQE